MEGEGNGAPPTTDAVEEGVDAGIDRDVEAFPVSSRVTSTGSIKCIFLVNEELVPINIERIPVIIDCSIYFLKFVSNIPIIFSNVH